MHTYYFLAYIDKCEMRIAKGVADKECEFYFGDWFLRGSVRYINLRSGVVLAGILAG